MTSRLITCFLSATIGLSPFACGQGSPVIGDRLNIGQGNTVSTIEAAAIGSSNEVNSVGSFAVGVSNVISSSGSLYTTAFGFMNVNEAFYALVVGSMNTLHRMPPPNDYAGEGSLVVGLGNYNGGGGYSLMVGENNYNTVDAYCSTTVGCGLINYWIGSAIFGQYNRTAGLQTAGLIFAIANGADATHRSNAMEVYQDGSVLIPKRQGDILMGEFGNPGD